MSEHSSTTGPSGPEQVAGWATSSTSEDGYAHQLVEQGTDQAGRLVHASVCGRVTGSDGWELARPAVPRCQDCQESVAGTPD